MDLVWPLSVYRSLYLGPVLDSSLGGCGETGCVRGGLRGDTPETCKLVTPPCLWSIAFSLLSTSMPVAIMAVQSCTNYY